MTVDYDVVVIGSGAGGGTIANVLAHAGKRVLILERGDFLPKEPDNWNPAAVFIDGKYVSPDMWIEGKRNTTFQPQSHYYVGGATKMYGAALFRLRPIDFLEYARPQGISPAWPIGYEEMEPWYTAAEWMYHVHGEHGQDPTEGWASKDYPHHAVSHEPRIRELWGQLHDQGLHPFSAPCGILLDEEQAIDSEGLRWGKAKHTSACVRCAMCDGYPCPLGAKADAQTIAVDPILGMPNVELVTGARVLRLLPQLHDPRSVASVEYLPNGVQPPERVTADMFVLSAGAVNSAVILLASRLANSSDQVGRNYMSHNSRAVIAIGETENTTRYQKTLALNDFYRDFGSVQMLGRSNVGAMKGESLAARIMPQWSTAKVVRHALDFWLMTEDLPLPENRVTLSGRHPVLTVKQTGSPEMLGLYGKLRAAVLDHRYLGHTMLDRSQFHYKGMPLAAVAHQAGTARFGTDPKTSVLDVNCRAHDVDNLYVVDASFMPSVGAVNPALTIMANALRVGDYIARLGK